VTPKQKRFVAEYLIDLNAKQAAIRAGYSPKTAEVQGSVLLRNPKVNAAVAEKSEKIATKLELSAEWVLAEIKKLAEANMMDYMTITDSGEAFVDFSKLTRDQAAAIQEITIDETGGGGGDGRREKVQRTRFKLASKRDSLELLGKHLKLFTDKTELTGPNGGPVDTNINIRFVNPDGSDA
jgi:phage terminase small subunit